MPIHATLGEDGKVPLSNLPDPAIPDWNNLVNVPATFPATAHTHPISDVTGLQTALDGKQAAGTYADASHTHTIANVTGLQTALDGKQATLVSGSSIKTVNNISLLGAGNITITGGGGGGASPIISWVI